MVSTSLTPAQLEAVEYFTNPSFGFMNTQQISKKLEIDRATLWRWRQIPEFQAEIRERTQQRLIDVLPSVDDAVIKKAIGGDLKAAELLYKRLNLFIEAKAGGNTQIGKIEFVIGQAPALPLPGLNQPNTIDLSPIQITTDTEPPKDEQS
jgi:hypothetical protein